MYIKIYIRILIELRCEINCSLDRKSTVLHHPKQRLLQEEKVRPPSYREDCLSASKDPLPQPQTQVTLQLTFRTSSGCLEKAIFPGSLHTPTRWRGYPQGI